MQKLIGTLKFLTNLCKSSLLSKFIYTRTNTVQNHLLPENVCICKSKTDETLCDKSVLFNKEEFMKRLTEM